MDDLNRKKGLISQVKIKDESGKLYKLTPDKIKYMYLAPSGLDKVGKALDVLTDATKWNDEKLDQDLIKQGYVYIEQSEVMLKKKKMVLLMQLLNPTSSKEVKIYHDPLAKETASVGIGGINVAGGDAKSYFVKKGNGVAVKLEKKDYKKSFKELWGDCADMMSKYGDNPKWLDLAKHALEYCECKK